MAFLDDFVNIVTNSFDPANLLGFGHGNSASSRGTNSGSILGDTWDKFMNGNSNDVNWRIAQDNLAYQRERNEIEDERYAEETAYNRSWAEEERDYNRALQQQLFEREDTAQLRQAEQLSKLGINPLSQQLNGAGAGAQVSSATPASASSRGGNALHNDYQQIPGGIAGVLSSLSGLAQTVNGVATGQLQRDALALQNDSQLIDNIIKAKKNGVNWYQPSSKSDWTKHVNGFDTDYFEELQSSANYDDINKKREYQSKKQLGVFDWEDSQTKLLKSLGAMDFQALAEGLLTNVAKAGNWLNTNFKDFAKDMEHNAIMSFVKKFFAF